MNARWMPVTVVLALSLLPLGGSAGAEEGGGQWYWCDFGDWCGGAGCPHEELWDVCANCSVYECNNPGPDGCACVTMCAHCSQAPSDPPLHCGGTIVACPCASAPHCGCQKACQRDVLSQCLGGTQTKDCPCGNEGCACQQVCHTLGSAVGQTTPCGAVYTEHEGPGYYTTTLGTAATATAAPAAGTTAAPAEPVNLPASRASTSHPPTSNRAGQPRCTTARA